MAKIRDLAISTIAFTYGPDRNIGNEPPKPRPCNPTPPQCQPSGQPPGKPKPNKEFGVLPQESVILLRRQMQHQIRRQLDS